jgi:hypothetical protein
MATEFPGLSLLCPAMLLLGTRGWEISRAGQRNVTTSVWLQIPDTGLGPRVHPSLTSCNGTMPSLPRFGNIFCGHSCYAWLCRLVRVWGVSQSSPYLSDWAFDCFDPPIAGKSMEISCNVSWSYHHMLSWIVQLAKTFSHVMPRFTKWREWVDRQRWPCWSDASWDSVHQDLRFFKPTVTGIWPAARRR